MSGISRRKRIWGWYFFDWASQPYHTLLVTFIFAPFFVGIAADFYVSDGFSDKAASAKAQSLWSVCLAVTGLIIGLGAPFLGALADTAGRRMPYIIVFTVMAMAGGIGLWWTDPSGGNLWWALLAFGFGFIGAEYAMIFVNSQLPSLGDPRDVGAISGSGFAFGYLGGVASLFIMLLFFVEQANGKTLVGLDPAFGLLDASQMEGTRFAGPFSALWFAVFLIPYLMWVRDIGPKRQGQGVATALRQLGRSVKNLRHRLSLSAYLGSSMFYRDALNGLYGFGGTYARLVLNWELVSIGIFGIIGAISAAVFSWVGGKADRRFGPKPVITAAVIGLIVVCTVIVGLDREQFFGIPLEEGSTLPDVIFFGCGMLIGGLGGVLQAASRSLMSRHADPLAPTESFGLYGLAGRATAFLAPALIGLVTTLTGSARLGISPVILLFLIGLLLLRWVKAEGDQEQWVAKSH